MELRDTASVSHLPSKYATKKIRLIPKQPYKEGVVINPI